MSPLAPDAVQARQHLPANHDASADTGAEDGAEYAVGPPTGPINRLRQREAVGVVGDTHFAVETLLQHLLYRLAVQRDGV